MEQSKKRIKEKIDKEIQFIIHKGFKDKISILAYYETHTFLLNQSVIVLGMGKI